MRFPSFVDDLPLTRRALEFAAARHGGQEREADHALFILHPLEVAEDDAVAIYAADKVAKVRELRMALAAGDASTSCSSASSPPAAGATSRHRLVGRHRRFADGGPLVPSPHARHRRVLKRPWNALHGGAGRGNVRHSESERSARGDG